MRGFSFSAKVSCMLIKNNGFLVSETVYNNKLQKFKWAFENTFLFYRWNVALSYMLVNHLDSNCVPQSEGLFFPLELLCYPYFLCDNWHATLRRISNAFPPRIPFNFSRKTKVLRPLMWVYIHAVQSRRPCFNSYKVDRHVWVSSCLWFITGAQKINCVIGVERKVGLCGIGMIKSE